jgi:hypothetical protein
VCERRRLVHDVIRFETELWDAVDERLHADVGLPLNWFEPRTIIDQLEACPVNDIADVLSITVGSTRRSSTVSSPPVSASADPTQTIAGPH